ncbi:putative RNA demethylase ALKBH9B/ALKBH10B [Helianthus annuus]|nr:putative RNA demethylase ALKBH9B/ALKBH10B [Helianthus annuus]
MSQPATAAVMPEAFAKDAIISWFRGEFAAANAIIDALCGHLSQFEGGKGEYESVFSAIHRRRLNWIPILQMQKYYSIADVTMELQKVVEEKMKLKQVEKKIVFEEVETKGEISEMDSAYIDIDKNNGGEVVDDDSNKDNHSLKSGITDAGMLYNLYS